jgi:hypothetical protein
VLPRIGSGTLAAAKPGDHLNLRIDYQPKGWWVSWYESGNPKAKALQEYGLTTCFRSDHGRA